MKLLLTHCYFISEDAREQQVMRPYVPLGLLYISAWLEKHHAEHEVFDTTFSSFEKLTSFIDNMQPDVIGIYVNLMTKLNVLKLITYIRKEKDLQHIKIILGGPEVRNNAQQFLNHGADYLVLGEGEESFYELFRFLEEYPTQIPDQIKGICFLRNGEMVSAPPREKIKDIDVLPAPNRKKVDLQLYLEAWKNKHGKNAISVSTMRGCPYTCKWCSRAVYGLSYRRRSAALVADELLSIRDQYHPDTIWFVDDVFTVSHKWMKEFAAAVKEKNIHLPYECITRADRLNEEVIKLLKESGCFRVWIGAESGSQKIIDAMDRRVDVEQVREMIQLTKRYGIETGTFIMLGYPGETEADIEETIYHLKASNPDHFTITIAYPIKGTELYTEVESDFTEPLPWDHSTDRDIDFKRTYSRKYYDFAVRRVVSEVNNFKHPSLKLKIKSLVAKFGMWYYRRLEV